MWRWAGRCSGVIVAHTLLSVRSSQEEGMSGGSSKLLACKRWSGLCGSFSVPSTSKFHRASEWIGVVPFYR